ncbi:MAG: hypothetical protein N4A46_13585 [Schleiferiaceae bacterium]|nr:hypothetical protein [Schleiferiaceae bacterium]
MENSIEMIWKKGFLNSDALIAPKLNNLYNQKSQNIVEKLKRMFKVNLYAILVFATLSTGLYAALGVPIAGLFIFSLLMVVSWRSYQTSKTLSNLDNSINSYEYLKSFNQWINDAIEKNTKIMRVFYGLIFLASLMPIVHAIKAGEVTNAAMQNSGLHLIYGIPTIGWVAALTIALLMFAFGGKIYRWDVNIVYGSTFKKLESIIIEMEELRKGE